MKPILSDISTSFTRFQRVIIKFNIQLKWLHVFAWLRIQTTDNILRLKGGRKVWWIASWKVGSENYVQLFAKWNWISSKSVRGRKLSFVSLAHLTAIFNITLKWRKKNQYRFFLLASANHSEAEIKRKFHRGFIQDVISLRRVLTNNANSFLPCIIFLHSQMNSDKETRKSFAEGNHSIVLI